jgi:hypothetical protein
MLQRILSAFQSIPRIGVTNRNFLMISGDIRKGLVIISYKGKVKYGKFEDNTLRSMMTGKHFDKNVAVFLNGTGKLIHQIINE